MQINHGDPQLSSQQLQILAAVGVTNKLVGAGLIVESATRLLQVAAQLWPDSPLDEWHRSSIELKKTIRLAAESSESVATTLFQQPSTDVQVFNFFSGLSLSSDLPFHRSVLGLIGRCWVIHSQDQQLIPASFTKGMRALINETLTKGKRSKDWRQIVGIDILDPGQVLTLLQNLPHREAPSELLRNVLHVLEQDITPISEKSSEVETNRRLAADSPEDSWCETTNASELHTHEASTSESEPDKVVLDSRRIGARLNSADYSPATAKLGIDHREHLLIADLSSITKRLSEDLTAEDKVVKGFAAFHLLCLVTATSDKYVLKAQLTPHLDHIWLDINLGTWCWDFSSYRYSGKERPEPPNVETINVPLPTRLLEVLRSAHNPIEQACVEDLICSIQEVDQFDLEGSRRYLQELGDKAHRPYRARWSKSMTSAVLEITGSDMFTAFVTAQFACTAPASLYYYCPSYESVYLRLDNVFSVLGLGTAIRPFDEHDKMGTTKLPSKEIVQTGWAALTSDIAHTKAMLISAGTDCQIVEQANKLMELLAAAFVLMSAHRCQRFDELTYGALTSSLWMLVILDKEYRDESTRSHPRLLGKTDPLKAIISSGVYCRELLFSRLGKELPAPTENTPVFCNYTHDPHLSEHHISSKSVSEAIARYFDEANSNFGRALWITTMDENHCDRWLIRALSGHVRDITRTTGAYFDIPPSAVASQLADCMNSLFESTFGQAKVSPEVIEDLHFLPSISTEDEHLTAREARLSPHTILEPITSITLTCERLAEKIRLELRSARANDLKDSTRLFLSLVFIDLLDGQAIALPAVQQPDKWFSTVGLRRCIKWNRPHFVHAFCFPMGPECALLQSQVGSKCISQTDLTRDIKKFFTQALEVEVQGDVLMQVCSWARAYKRVHFPPSLLASSSTFVESPCLNQESIARLAGLTPTFTQVPENTKPSERSRVNVTDDIDRIGRILNHFGDTNKRLGERQLRAINALSDLRTLPDQWSPSGLFLRDWVGDELVRSRDNQKGRYEVSSISTYFSRLKTQIGFCGEDPYDWSSTEWLQYILLLENKSGRGKFSSDEVISEGTKNALAALARSLIRRGYGFPNELWTYINLEETESIARDSASSVLVTSKDVEVISALIESAVGDYYPNFLRCKFRLKLGTAIPVRAGEFSGLKKMLTTASGGLVIERAGFNSIKNSHSIRIAQLSTQDQVEINEIAAQLRATVTEGDLLLRGTGKDRDNEEDLKSITIFGTVLKRALGDPKARPHSLRATTLQNLTWPDWQFYSGLFLNFKISAFELQKWSEKLTDFWLRTATTSAVAGHSGIGSAIHNYLAGWTVVHSLYSARLSLNIPFQSSYLAGLGVSGEAFRQAKSRTKGDSKNTWILFDWLEKKLATELKAIQKAQSPKVPGLSIEKKSSNLQSHGAPREISSEPRPQPKKLAEKVSPHALHFVVARSLGKSSESLQNDLLLSNEEVKRLSKFLLREELVAECLKRARNAAQSRGISAQTRILAEETGIQLLEWVANLHGSKLECAKYGFLWFLPKEAKPDPVDLETWEELSDTLPTLFSLQVHRGRHHLNRLELVYQGNHRLSFRPERDIGARHRVSMRLSSDADNRVQTSRLTSLTQLALLSYLSIKEDEDVS